MFRKKLEIDELVLCNLSKNSAYSLNIMLTSLKINFLKETLQIISIINYISCILSSLQYLFSKSTFGTFKIFLSFLKFQLNTNFIHELDFYNHQLQEHQY